MHFTILILLVTVALANAIQLKLGPQTFATPSTKTKEQPSQKRFANDEVILYLNSNQIRPLQTGGSIITGDNVQRTENQDLKKLPEVSSLEEDYLRQQLLQFLFPQEPRVVSVEEQIIETEKPSSPQADSQQQTSTSPTENPTGSLSNTYVNFYPSLHIRESRPSIYLQESKQVEQLQQNKDEIKSLPTPGSNQQLLPYQQHTEHNETEAQQILELSKQLQRLLNHNRAQLKAPQNLNNQPTEVLTQSPQSNNQPGLSWYSNEKYPEELEQQKKRQELDRRNALYRAEAIANLPYEVPKPYGVPLEIIRNVPIAVVQSEKEVNTSAEIEKRVPMAVVKKVYVNVDRPYFVDRVVPVGAEKEVPIRKAKNGSFLRYIWQ